jgi:iron complex transport system permease protein
MTRWNLSQLIATIAMSVALWAVVAAACLMVGSTGINWPTGLEMILRREPVLVASLVGAALGAAGCAYQAVLRNPLADPYLLGASSGAALAAYVWRLPMLAGLLTAPGTWGLIFAEAGQEAFAFAGALAAVAIVLAVAATRLRGRLEPVTLLLVGVIVNAVNGSIYLLLNAIHKDNPGGGGETSLLVGGIRLVTHLQLSVAASLAAIGVAILFFLSGKLSVAVLGDDEIESLGVGVHRLRWAALSGASLATAAAVAISGPIAFVGLICPHIARRLVGSDQRRLLPAATAAGAILLALADAISRLLASQNLLGTELQVGILTGLLGGPFFLVLLKDRKL